MLKKQLWILSEGRSLYTISHDVPYQQLAKYYREAYVIRLSNPIRLLGDILSLLKN